MPRITRILKELIHKESILKVIKNLILYESFMMFYILQFDPVKKYAIFPTKVPEIDIQPVYLPITLREFEKAYSHGEDFREHAGKWKYEEGDDGTYAFWVSSKGKFVHSACFGTSITDSEYLQVKDAYEVHGDMDRGYSATGGFATTSPDFRRMGVYAHTVTWIYAYLRERGFKRILSLFRWYVVGPQKMQWRLGANFIAKIDFSQLFGTLIIRKYIMGPPNPRVFYQFGLASWVANILKRNRK